MTAKQLLLITLLAILSAAAGFFLYKGSPPRIDAPAIAGEAPAFVLPDIEGTERHSEEWSGSVRLINFWATWCPPCRREIPLLIDLQEEHGRSIQVLGIAIDDMEAVEAYAAEKNFNYPVLVGQQDAIDIANAFLSDFIGLPFTAFVDENGKLVHVHVGELHRDQAEEFLSELL